MPTRPPVPTESIECPLCQGAGKLKRTEILDRLGVKDFARVAQLSAEEAFRLLQNRHDHDQQSVWSRFETELAKRTAEIRERHKDELRSAQSDRDDLTRRVEDCLREVAQLRERNQQLEAEMAKVARRGKAGGDQLRGRGADVGGHRRQREACQERRLHLGVPRSQRRSAGAVHSRGQQGQGDCQRRRHQETDPRRQGTSQSGRESSSRGKRASFVSLTANDAGGRRTASGFCERRGTGCRETSKCSSQFSSG